MNTPPIGLGNNPVKPESFTATAGDTQADSLARETTPSRQVVSEADIFQFLRSDTDEALAKNQERSLTSIRNSIMQAITLPNTTVSFITEGASEAPFVREETQLPREVKERPVDVAIQLRPIVEQTRRKERRGTAVYVSDRPLEKKAVTKVLDSLNGVPPHSTTLNKTIKNTKIRLLAGAIIGGDQETWNKIMQLDIANKIQLKNFQKVAVTALTSSSLDKIYPGYYAHHPVASSANDQDRGDDWQLGAGRPADIEAALQEIYALPRAARRKPKHSPPVE